MEQISSLYDLSKKVIRDKESRYKTRYCSIIFTFVTWILIFLGYIFIKKQPVNYVFFFRGILIFALFNI